MNNMNNIKIGKRISEIDIYKFLLNRLNDNTLGIKFKMGLNDNLFWYRPYNKLSKEINVEYTFNEETYEYEKSEFVPIMISINDLGLSSGLDFLSGSATTSIGFRVLTENYTYAENVRTMIEEIRDNLRQGFYIHPVPQIPMNKTEKPTSHNFKFNTNSGTISYEQFQYENGKMFMSISFGVDIEFSDLLYYGNEYMWECAIKTQHSDTWSDYERIYPISGSFAIVRGTKDKQELANDENTLDDAWESKSILQNKAFSLTMDFAYRDLHPTETVGIIKYLYKETFKKTVVVNGIPQNDYNLYKIRLSKYNLSSDNETWTAETDTEIGFERIFIALNNSTSLELGNNVPISIDFVPSALD